MTSNPQYELASDHNHEFMPGVGAAVLCPACDEHLYTALVGCLHCIAYAGLRIAYHIMREHHDQFMHDINAMLN